MKIELITPETHALLIDIYKNFPELSLQNKGYEGINRDLLSPDAKEKDKIVNEILKKSIFGFSRFQNFKKNKNDESQIRFQYDYRHDGEGSILSE